STITYRTYRANLIFTFERLPTAPPSIFGGKLARSFPITLAVAPGTNLIDRCFTAQASRYLCEQMGGYIDDTTKSCTGLLNTKDACNYPYACSQANWFCPWRFALRDVHFFEGFDYAKRPKCRCWRVCVKL